MIIAPLATPIYGVALATTIGSTKALRNSLLLLVSGIGVNILVGIFVAATSFNRMPLDANPQITGRTAPTILDLTVAVAVGIAGSFALARRDVSNIVAGVAIAISLVPVLAVVGITLGRRPPRSRRRRHAAVPHQRRRHRRLRCRRLRCRPLLPGDRRCRAADRPPRPDHDRCGPHRPDHPARRQLAPHLRLPAVGVTGSDGHRAVGGWHSLASRRA